MAENTLGLTFPQQDYNLKDGLTLLTSMYKNTYLQEVSGVRTQYFNMVLTGYQFGTVKTFPARYREALNEAIIRIGTEMMQTRLTDTDTLAQVKELGKKMPLRHLFVNCLGWTEDKMKQRVSSRNGNMYGKFEAEHIQKLNETIAVIAMRTLQIHLVGNEQENTPKYEESVTAVQESCKKTS